MCPEAPPGLPDDVGVRCCSFVRGKEVLGCIPSTFALESEAWRKITESINTHQKRASGDRGGAAEISGRPKSLKHSSKTGLRRSPVQRRGSKSLKHSAETGRGDLREAQILETLIKNGPPEIAGAAPGQQILETLCKNGPRRSPGGPNP